MAHTRKNGRTQPSHKSHIGHSGGVMRNMMTEEEIRALRDAETPNPYLDDTSTANEEKPQISKTPEREA